MSRGDCKSQPNGAQFDPAVWTHTNTSEAMNTRHFHRLMQAHTLSVASIAAPISSRLNAVLALPVAAATMSAVIPSTFPCAFTFAPESRSSIATSEFPAPAASSTAVYPFCRAKHTVMFVPPQQSTERSALAHLVHRIDI